MEKRIKNFLRGSFISLIIICIVVFVWLTFFMSERTGETVLEVSESYMSEMNIQLRQKFTSIVELRLEQVEGIIRRTPPDTVTYGDDMLEALQTSVEVREFDYWGLYTEKDGLEILNGKEIELKHPEEVNEQLRNDSTIVAQGIGKNDEMILILGVPADYPMEDGKKSDALMVGIPMNYLNEALYLYSDDAAAYSYIIDKEGNFIIRNADAYRSNYFERIKEEFEEVDGKAANQYGNELRSAMDKGESYFALIQVKGERRNIYCSPIAENSTWYLITVMPNGVLEKSITKLDTLRSGIMIGSSLILLLAMCIVFSLYYRLSQQQVDELNKARQEAVRANMAKSDFLSSMSHDIRTPMNAIIGMTEIALKNRTDSVRVEDCLRKVKLSSKHLLGLINDVLDMSKIESGKMTLNISQMSLREAMDDIVNIM